MAWKKRTQHAGLIAALMMGMGFFSSDRCINEYAESIWNVEPLAPETGDTSGLGKGEL